MIHILCKLHMNYVIIQHNMLITIIKYICTVRFICFYKYVPIKIDIRAIYQLYNVYFRHFKPPSLTH
jgi:hypothetical protein